MPEGQDIKGLAEIIGPVGILVEKHILNKGTCKPDGPCSLLAPDETVPCDESEAIHDPVP
jgi:hypothetical protein